MLCRLTVSIVLVVLAGGCAGAPPQGDTSDAVQPSVSTLSSSPATTETATSTASAEFSFDVVRGDGYTFSYTFSFEFGTAVSDITNALPGTTDVFQPFEAAMSVVNTTPGRQAPSPLPATSGFPIQGLYPVDGAVCPLDARREIELLDGRGYCVVPLIAFTRTVHGGLPSGATETALVTPFFGDQADIVLYEVPESVAPAVIAELPAAPYYFLDGDSDWESTGAGAQICGIAPTELGAINVVWSSTPIPCVPVFVP